MMRSIAFTVNGKPASVAAGRDIAEHWRRIHPG